MGFNSKEFEYADVKVLILGVSLTGLRGLTYKKKQDKAPVYGQGNQPKGIQRGNKSYDGNLMLLKNDFDMLNAAARAAGYEDLTDVPGKDIHITCVYQSDEVSTILKTDSCFNCEFLEFEEGMKQGDQFKELSLPFVFLRLKQS